MFGQWTPSEPQRHVPALLRSYADLLSDQSRHPAASAVDGAVTGILGSRGTRPVPLPHVQDRPNLCAPDETVTVVICAQSVVRWDDLVAAPWSVKQQTRRSAEIVLVIDHNLRLQRRSTFALPGVKAIPNDNEEGLAGARNAGVAAATSEIVASSMMRRTPGTGRGVTRRALARRVCAFRLVSNGGCRARSRICGQSFREVSGETSAGLYPANRSASLARWHLRWVWS